MNGCGGCRQPTCQRCRAEGYLSRRIGSRARALAAELNAAGVPAVDPRRAFQLDEEETYLAEISEAASLFGLRLVAWIPPVDRAFREVASEADVNLFASTSEPSASERLAPPSEAPSEPIDFTTRRLRGLIGAPNSEATPADALRIALGEIERGEVDVHALVVAIETENGDLRLVTAAATYSGALWILERAKLLIVS